jgi:hypothetical protein
MGYVPSGHHFPEALWGAGSAFSRRLEFRGVSGQEFRDRSFGEFRDRVSGQTKLPRIVRLSQLEVRMNRMRRQLVRHRTQAASWVRAFAESGGDWLPSPMHE